MRVIIAGCGRVGAGLAAALDGKGHEVVVIDRDVIAFERIPRAYEGRRIVGIVFDRATLVDAGIEDCDAFIAVTSGDNSNIVAARTARERFDVPVVIARIYDPARAEIYERHGITTIASARWTVDAILEHLNPDEFRREATIGPGEGDVVVISHDLPSEGGPWEIEVFAAQGRWLPAAITRTGQTTIPVPRQLVQAGERVHLAVQRAALDAADEFLRGLGRVTAPTSDHDRRDSTAPTRRARR